MDIRLEGFKRFFAHLLGMHQDNLDRIPDYRAILLLAGVIFISSLVLIAIAVKIFKPQLFKKFASFGVVASAQFALTFILVALIEIAVTPTRNISTGYNAALTWSTIAMFCGLLVLGTFVNYFKPHRFNTFVKAAVLAILVHGLVVISAAIGWAVQRDESVFGTNAQGENIFKVGYRVVAWLTLALGITFAVGVVFLQHNKVKHIKKNETLAVAFAAVCVAMSFALSYVRFFRMPVGGSVTLARFVPLAIYSYIFGVRRGLIAGLVWGTMRLFVDPFIIHPMQFILEYPLSFMMVGLAGLFKNIKLPASAPQKFSLNGRLHPAISLTLGLVTVAFVRYIIHVVSGVIWISDFAPDVAEKGGGAVLSYSLSFNAVQLVDALISILVGALLMLSPQIKTLIRQTEEKFLYYRTK